METETIERTALDGYPRQLSRKQILDRVYERMNAECQEREIDSYSYGEGGGFYFGLWHAYDLIEEILKEANVD